tara:strand:+ start:48 stop:1442 length:1395 start_codon:yes stop_codon:yes gene_type:complete
MAVALKFNGINNYVQTPSGGSAVTALMPTDEWMIEFKIKRVNDRAIQYILTNSYGGIRVYFRDTIGALTIITNNTIHTSIVVPNDGEFHIVRVVLSNSFDTVKCYLDDMVTPVDILSGKDASFAVHGGGTGSLHRILLGRYQHTSGGWFEGEIEYAHLKDLAGDAEFYFSAEASDREITGAQPVLVDTIGNNNATGVNFPTDGSAWVDLGGGTVDLIFSDSEQKPTSDSIAIQNINQLSFLDSLSQPASDSISLELITELLFSDSLAQPLADSITLQNITELLLNDSLVQPTSDLSTLQNLTQLSFTSSTANVSSDSIVITQQGNLYLFDSIIQPKSDTLTLENIAELLISDSVVSLSSDSITIENLSQLLFSDSAVQPTSDTVTIVNAQGLVFSDSTIQPTSDSITIELYTELSFSDSIVQPLSDSINITTQVMPFFGNNDLLLIDNTIRYHLIDNTTDYRIK